MRRNSTHPFMTMLLFVALFFPLMTEGQTIRTGADSLFRCDLSEWSDKQIAVVTNHTAKVGESHLVDSLISCGVSIRTLFCPEHGFRGTAAAGAHIANSVDSATGIPIVSLYGKNKKPTAQQLRGIELVLFDLQDVGCRFYTYISTLHYVMESCAEEGIPLIVLDRPNPNGHYVDGPLLDTTLRSFVGMHPVPIVYGMTIGEYAQMINGEHWLAGGKMCDLTIVPLSGYTHDSICCRSVVLPVPPSPNLRTPQAIALYPSLCLFEGSSISLGRGTPFPFEVIGNKNYPLDLRQVSVPSRLDLSYLIEIYNHTPKGTFFLKNNFFDKLAGSTSLRHQIEKGLSQEQIRATWQADLEAFKEVRSHYLIYP